MVLASCLEQGSTPCYLFFNAFLALRHFQLQCNHANVCRFFFFIFAPLLRLDKTGLFSFEFKERRNVVFILRDFIGFNLKRRSPRFSLFCFSSGTGWRVTDKNFASSCCDEPTIERIGRNGTSVFCVLGNPYILGLCEPEGRMSL